jgi:probable HAF family extracellular repeat protein
MRNLKSSIFLEIGLALGCFAIPAAASVSAYTCTTFSYGDPSWPVTTTGINANKQIIGYAMDAQGRPHGFLRNADGTTVTIDDPATGFVGTYPRAINILGQVVGNYYLPDGPHGFFRNTDGTVTEIAPPSIPSPPGTTVVLTTFSVSGINDSGVVSGVYNAAFNYGSSGYQDRWFYVFTRDPDGTYQIVDTR